MNCLGLALIAAVAHTLRSSPCSRSGSTVESATLAEVVASVCTVPSFASTPMCAFRPKYHWLPFLVWRISGSRLPASFLVEEGAWMIVASTIVPDWILMPWSPDARSPLPASSHQYRAFPAGDGTAGQSSHPAPQPCPGPHPRTCVPPETHTTVPPRRGRTD